MKKINDKILNIDKVICKNIDIFDDSERGLLSQNILAQLRNFVEHISLKVYANGNEIENTYENIVLANEYIKTRGNLRFLSKFHRLLQKSASHYTLNEENSERLMLKYYEYLIKIKVFLKNTFNLDVLNNIEDFPIANDPNLKEYYEKIASKIDQLSSNNNKNDYNDRYYIQKIKPFFVHQRVYYEITFTLASDNTSKFDRIIAFTDLDISSTYAIKISVKIDSINILNKDMPILIIEKYEVSIRPCEINNFSRILGYNFSLTSGSSEYRNLMKYLTMTGLNLEELLEFSDKYYINIKNSLTKNVKTKFFTIIDECRNLIQSNAPGNNVIRYLLYRMNNKIIKKQYKPTHFNNYEGCYKINRCELLSNLYLDYGCIVFDKMPLNSSLINHNPKLTDLFDCIETKNREHELFARLIKNNTEINGQLYTFKNEIKGFENIDSLIKNYNNKLYSSHGKRRLENYKDNIYISEYEDDTFQIIKKLKELASSGIQNYSNSVNSWLHRSSYYIDCVEKKSALIQMFEYSKVAFIYGAAGTGKSFLINHVSNFFDDKQKIYLANTNPAVDNLKRKVNASNCIFKTVAKFLSHKNNDLDCDILIIDECSTISNKDMKSILQKGSFKIILLVGDIFQIESIIFGNWFNIARSFVPRKSIFELTETHRSKNTNLLSLWSKVRRMDEAILEVITKNNYSISLNETIFDKPREDEIILCLNYDGLYGINNINRFLQSNNENVPIEWGIQTFKIGDPILFNDSERFAPLIYNNLKGKIIGIEKLENKIIFDIEIDKVINELDAEGYSFDLIGASENGNSKIRFSVNKYKGTDDDDDLSSETLVPFQIAYAVSIHKAQGLEYNSVKIVITNEIEELITHNIFYTAITRAKETLKIYWSPETEKKVLENLKLRNNTRDIAIFKTKFIL